jgi:hypothetical protein
MCRESAVAEGAVWEGGANGVAGDAVRREKRSQRRQPVEGEGAEGNCRIRLVLSFPSHHRHAFFTCPYACCSAGVDVSIARRELAVRVEAAWPIH